MLNNILDVTGHIGKEPEMRYTTTGKEMASFSVAVSHGKKNAAGEWLNSTMWVKVTAFGQLALVVSEKWHKGDLVRVVGPLNFDAKTGGPTVYVTRNNVSAASFEMTANEGMMLKTKAEALADMPRHNEDEEVPF